MPLYVYEVIPPDGSEGDLIALVAELRVAVQRRVVAEHLAGLCEALQAAKRAGDLMAKVVRGKATV